MSSFRSLSDPIDLGTLRVKNRIAMAPTTMNFGDFDGSASERNVAFYVKRALGGAGLIIVENVSPFPALKVAGQLGIWDYRHIPGLSDIAEAIRLLGSRAALQIFQPSVEEMVSTTLIPTFGLSSPPLARKTVNELSIKEIGEFEDAFAEAAVKTKIAGFEAVEIHGAHGHIISSFLSRYLNRRNDEYGGSVKHRTRIASELIEKIKEKVGASYPIIFRMNGSDFVDGGNSIEEVCEIAKILERSGADALHVSAGIYRSIEWVVQPIFTQLGALAPLAERIKRSVELPVIVAGRINNSEIAENIVKNGQADMVSLSRALLADPDFPSKTLRGRSVDIRPCIALCMDACIGKVTSYQRGRCAVNPEVGRERDSEISAASSPKKVLIIGGGPAGLEAARIASLRGHFVVLCESRHEIGGQLLLASRLPHKQEAKRLIDWYRRQLGELKVKVTLDTQVTSEIVRKIEPDVIILATGAKYDRPFLQVSANYKIVDPVELLSGAVFPGSRVAIVGGGTVGCDVAIWLAKEGKKIVVVEMDNDVASEADQPTRRMIKQQFEILRINTMLRCVPMKYVEEGILVRTPFSGASLVKCDTLVLASSIISERSLMNSPLSLGAYVYVIGDAKEPRRLMDAVHEGYSVGRIL